jgi:hypothetical protein
MKVKAIENSIIEILSILIKWKNTPGKYTMEKSEIISETKSKTAD